MDVLHWPNFLKVKILVIALVYIMNSGCKKDEPNSIVFKESLPTCEAARLKERYIIYWKDNKISFAAAASSNEVLHHVQENQRNKIKFIENDYRITIPQPISLSEENVDYSAMAHAENGQWGIDRINAPSAWSRSIRGEGIIVAVIDTAIDTSHPLLEHQIAFNAGEVGLTDDGVDRRSNGIDDDGNGFIDDFAGYNFYYDTGEPVAPSVVHGTHVAGIILSLPDDEVNSYRGGVAPKAKLLPVPFLGPDGGRLGDAIKALNYAVMRGAKIINASWGGSECSSALQEVVERLSEQGIIFVAAAGNSSSNIDELPEYPAAYMAPSQITVGSLSINSYMADHSNYGRDLVHLLAPGFEILSTIPKALAKRSLGSMTGTSMAAPFVSGALALLWSAQPEATYEEIIRALLAGVVRSEFPVQSEGYLDVAGSLVALGVN